MNRFEDVYTLVRKVPKGKVTTYGAIGKRLGMSPRVVGYALHLNPDPDLNPCHRVVNREGRVAPGYVGLCFDIYSSTFVSPKVAKTLALVLLQAFKTHSFIGGMRPPTTIRRASP